MLKKHHVRMKQLVVFAHTSLGACTSVPAPSPPFVPACLGAIFLSALSLFFSLSVTRSLLKVWAPCGGVHGTVILALGRFAGTTLPPNVSAGTPLALLVKTTSQANTSLPSWFGCFGFCSFDVGSLRALGNGFPADWTERGGRGDDSERPWLRLQTKYH